MAAQHRFRSRYLYVPDLTGAMDTGHLFRYTCIVLLKDGRWVVARGRGRDHDEVRQAIVDAAGTAVEQGGVESLTFRRVAAAADVSPGRVQHYFTDRASLVQACFNAVQDRARSRVETTLAAVEPSPAEVVSAILHTMIPRSPEDIRDLRVVTMFETLALTEPALGRRLLDGHAELRRLLIDQVAVVLRGSGSALEAADTTHSQTISDGLLATAGGLASEVLHGYLSSEEAHRILDAALSYGLDRKSCGLCETTANGTEAGHDA